MTCASDNRDERRQTGLGSARLARLGLALAAVLSAAVLGPAAALAGSPVHPPLPGETIEGLNHACGAAVDSEGDVYLSSAGESKVKIFDQSHTELTSIPNTHEPCGLAVDSQGNLYVSEKATGEVVRYHPSEYPPTASTTYSETTVDSSGNAQGISVDPFDDSLYVAEGTRVAMFSSEGTPGINEQQRVQLGGPETYKLKFEGSETEPIAGEASHEVVEEKLNQLASIGGVGGHVSVSQGPNNAASYNHLLTFEGALAGTDVGQVTCEPTPPGCVVQQTEVAGFNGHIGEGELSAATGVSAYTSQASSNFFRRRYISVAEPTSQEIEIIVASLGAASGKLLPATLETRATIDGSEAPEGELGLAAGASLGVDPGTGHLFASDGTHDLVNEFEATGHYFTTLEDPGFEDAEPTAIAVDRSGGGNDGTVYATAGPGSGARALLFGPVPRPSRTALGEPPSRPSASVCGTTVDSQGDVYVAGGTTIKVFDPAGDQLASFEDAKHPCTLAVDSQGNLYVANQGEGQFFANSGNESVVRYRPNAYPLSATPTWTEEATIETLSNPQAVAVDPVSGRLFVGHQNGALIQYGSATEGSGEIVSGFCGFSGGQVSGVDVYEKTGDVYVASPDAVTICNADGSRKLSVIDGSGGPGGAYGVSGPSLALVPIAVDQSNGHVLVGTMKGRGYVEEYDASGAFIADHGSFNSAVVEYTDDVALDNSGGPTNGNLYVAYSNKLAAFGPLGYGEPPLATTGTASEVGGGEATLNGTINPHGSEIGECRFDYVTKAAFEATGFSDLSSGGSAACVESASEIGAGAGSIAVHAQVGGLASETAYCFRLVATSDFGTSIGQQSCFDKPAATTAAAQPILYREATLHGEANPSGLETDSRFQYLTQAEYEAAGQSFAGAQSTPTKTLPASSGPAGVEGSLVGLQEGTTYRYRLIAENGLGEAAGEGREFTTQQRHPSLSCPNQTLRLENNSGGLPDCRAYELVTPADTRGLSPFAEVSFFNNWMVTPTGPLAGESLAYFLEGTLPGDEGNGRRDALRATRSSEAGWHSSLYSPGFQQESETLASGWQGISADQLYSFWGGGEPAHTYLRTPSGLEVLGQGSLATDIGATGKFISPGANHVIFASEKTGSHTPVRLEPGAPEPPFGAIYDRSPGGSTHVISLPPAGSTQSEAEEQEEFFATRQAIYEGATPDGSSVVFEVGGNLYLRRNDAETIEVTKGPATFAGISDDGKRVFYTNVDPSGANPGQPGDLFVFDVQSGSRTKVASNAAFVNVSGDGSHAYYLSGTDLEVWDGLTTHPVAAISPFDLFQGGQIRFPGTANDDFIALDLWAAGCVRPESLRGAAACPSRSTPDGKFLVFQSHADLTPPYEGQGHSEIYRYDAEAESLLCVSCDPSGSPASADADLQTFAGAGAPARGQTIIPNLTEDGNEVFFQTPAQLLPDDANSTTDVYEWQAQGTGGCTREGGCLSLISSGQGEDPSYLYSMTPDGHDVFFTTTQRLIPSDIVGSPSLYDARVEGGFSQPVEAEPCHGDACQGEGTPPPPRQAVRTDVPGAGNVENKVGCPKGRRRAKGKCVKRHHHKHRRHRKHHSRKTHSHGRRAAR